MQENRTLYGKYVSYNYLRVEYQRNSFLQGNSITLLSAVDGRGFAETGFVINGKRVAVPQLTERFRVFTAQMVFGRSVSRDALLMTMPYSLQGLQRGAAIEITPYWDGRAGRNDRLRRGAHADLRVLHPPWVRTGSAITMDDIMNAELTDILKANDI